MSAIADQLFALAKHTGAPDVVEDAAILIRSLEGVRAERDEARREVCELRCNPPERFVGLPHELAKINGWDCFPEATP